MRLRGLRRILVATALTSSMAAAAAGKPVASPGADADAEIRRLVTALGTSGCEFERNGTWHSATEAQAHLQRKHDWARRRGLSGTTETFIERAASRSSLSGKPYRVRCPDAAPMPSEKWMRDTLRRLRAAPPASPPR